ncbi:MAG: T9SS type A sorting domain-containing protein [Opitutaceae bacterium]|nr:T9SS type A sorting domain-containing protein [Cytophagales bacterium]
MKRNFTRFFIAILLMICGHFVQAQYQMEKLDRGMLAVRTGTNNFVSWRWLGTEDDITFNLYRNNVKVNSTPLTVTNYTDIGAAGNASYSVKAIINGVEQAASASVTPWAQNYMQIPLMIPPSGTTPTGEVYTYNANDCSLADLDGDGAWEIIVKWDPSNSKDNSQSGYTGKTFIDAYKLNGTRLWRIDFGVNIRAGAHYLDFMVFDFDGDGRAEMMARTGDGTRDGAGVAIGNANADYRTTGGYILTGPEYMTVFEGLTGKAMATKPLFPPRGVVTDWGDGYGNRVDRFKACVAYLDGKRPSGVFTRGYYAKWGAEAIDWRDGKLTTRWTYMCPNVKTNPCYEEGAHSVSVADVDGDGKQEIITGSLILDDDGTMYYNTAIGHGDALHVSDLDPDLPGLEISHIQEPVGNAGLYMYSGKTKNVLWRIASGAGVTEGPGRGVCADVTAKFRGAESWAAGGGVSGLYDVKGNKTTLATPQSCNFLAWWDGDLLRELLNGTQIDKYETGRLLTVTGCSSNNSTKSTPNLSGDFFGDWREEVMWRTSDNKFLRIYASTIPSTYKFRTFMHDPQYRVAIAWQNTGYNQPPHVSYYLGDGMTTPPKPNITIIGGSNPANVAPTASIVLPLTNATFNAPANITINATATDGDGIVTKVEFYNGSTKLGEDITSPYSFSWTNVAVGNYSLTAKSTDDDGAIGTSLIVIAKVTSTNAAPTISITSPTNNTIINGTPANITITATASDVNGTVAKVEFFEGTNKLGEDLTGPFTFNWTGVAANTYTLKAIATDNDGASITSSDIVISVLALPFDCNNISGGAAKLDACGRCTGGTTGKVACAAVTEAELACKFDGIREDLNEGYSDSGYVNVPNTVGASISFSIIAQNAGNASISFRYANGGLTSRPGQLTLNGVAIPGTIAFDSTGAWNDWEVIDVPLSFLKGNNDLILSATTASGLANIDQIGYLTAGLSVGNCGGITGLTDDKNFGSVNLFPNPSSKEFNIMLTELSDIKVIDMQGIIIEHASQVSSYEFGTGYPSGVYTVQVLGKGNTQIYKIIKK